MNRFRALWGKRIGGVPVPVIFAVVILAAYLIIRRRQAALATTSNAADTAALPADTPVGAMAGNGDYPSTGYSAPQPYGDASSGALDSGSLLNDAAGDTTVTGDPVGKTNAPAKRIPPKKSSARSSHKAGRSPKPTPPKVHAPARKTTIHKARVQAPARQPARAAGPVKAAPVKAAPPPRAGGPVKRK